MFQARRTRDLRKTEQQPALRQPQRNEPQRLDTPTEIDLQQLKRVVGGGPSLPKGGW